MWRFLEPRAFWLLILPALGLVYFLVARRSSLRRVLLPMSGPDGLLRQYSQRTKWVYRSFFATLLLCYAALVAVIARPVEITPIIKKSGEGIDIAIALDVSESMDADDLQPSRIDVAKAVIRDFIKRRTEDRIGIIVFSGEAVTKCPLTRDYDFLLEQVEDIHLRELKQGTAIGMGIANGIARLRKSESKSKVLILLTDGDSNVGAINPMTATQLARQDGIKIYTIGIGKSDRVIVPIYAYDGFGRRTQLIAQVPSYLNPELLKKISELTGGRSYMARDPGALSNILHEIDSLEKTKIKVSKLEKREELFFLPALLATLALLVVHLLQETRYRKARLHAV